MTAVLITVFVVLSIGCGGDGEGDSILVLAAASMTNVLVEVGQEFESESGVEVVSVLAVRTLWPDRLNWVLQRTS